MTIELLAPGASDVPLVRGRWANIRWKPNPSTGEILNIGLVFEEVGGRRHVKTIDVFDRVACLYNDAFAADAQFLARVVRESLAAGLDAPTGGVFLSESKFASGASADAVVSELFATTVPLGAPRRQKKKSRAGAGEGDLPVREQVFDALRQIAGLGADKIIASEDAMQVRDGTQIRYLDIPLQTRTALGTIVSTHYASRDTNELKLLRADSDLQTARRVYRRDSLFLYVVRPQNEANASHVDVILEGLTWKFGQVGVAMKTYTAAQQVAEDILEDMPL